MDGEQLGTVKEVRGRCFKVDAPMAPDYWLSVDNISSRTGGQVMLRFNKDQVGDYKVGEPDEVDTDAGRMTDYRATDATTTTGTMHPGGTEGGHGHTAGIGDHTHMGERAGETGASAGRGAMGGERPEGTPRG
jgi:hypothetical protein